MISVGFHPAARQELLSAASWYDGRVPKLGEELTAEAERVTALLAVQPELGTPIDSQHRRALLRRFPYLLIYRHNAQALTIIAVAHLKRRPGYWRNRN